MVSYSISVIPSWVHPINASILVDDCWRQRGLSSKGQAKRPSTNHWLQVCRVSQYHMGSPFPRLSVGTHWASELRFTQWNDGEMMSQTFDAKPPLKCSSHHEKRAGGYQTFGIPFMVFMDLSQAQTILGIYENSGTSSFDVTVPLEPCVGLKHIRRTLTPLESDTLRIEMCSPLSIQPSRILVVIRFLKPRAMFKILKKGLSSHPYFLLTPCEVFCLDDLTKRTNVRDMGLLIRLKDPEIRRQFCHFTSCRSYKVPWLSCIQAADGFVSPQQRVQCSLDLARLVIHLWHLDGHAEFDERISYCCQKLFQRHFSHALRNESPIKKSTTWWLGTLTIARKRRSPYGFCYVLFSSAHIQQYLKIYCSGRNWHHEKRCHPYHGQP